MRIRLPLLLLLGGTLALWWAWDSDAPTPRGTPSNGLIPAVEPPARNVPILHRRDFAGPDEKNSADNGYALIILAQDYSSQHMVPEVRIQVSCDSAHLHEVESITDAQGQAVVLIPHDGVWGFEATATRPDGLQIGIPHTSWIDRKTSKVVIHVAQPPLGAQLQASDASNGKPIPHASFSVARSPSDVRHLIPRWLAELPSALTSEGGLLQTSFLKPGRAYIKVEARGYMSEVVEWMTDDGEAHDVALFPVRLYSATATRRGQTVPVEATYTFSQHTLVLPSDQTLLSLARSPQCGTKNSSRSQKSGKFLLRIPDPKVQDAPDRFDLWLEDDVDRQFIGSLSVQDLPPPPWNFELEPATGTVQITVIDEFGHAVGWWPFQVSARIDASMQDSADVSRNGISERVCNADDQGLISIDMPAPSRITVVGSESSRGRWENVSGQLQAEQVLNLTMVVQQIDSTLSKRHTTGRVIFPKPLSISESQPELWILVTHLGEDAQRSIWRPNSFTQTVEGDGSFAMLLPPGRFAITLASEDFSLARSSGRFVECDAGDKDILLHLPTLSGLILHTTDAETAQTLTPDEADLFIGTKWLTWMDCLDSGDSVNLELMAEKVWYSVEKNGYVPAFGSVSLKSGSVTRKDISLHRGRTITLQTADASPLPKSLSLEWTNAPHATTPYEVPLDHGVWSSAPTSDVRLKVIQGFQETLMFIPSGMQDEILVLPMAD